MKSARHRWQVLAAALVLALHSGCGLALIQKSPQLAQPARHALRQTDPTRPHIGSRHNPSAENCGLIKTGGAFLHPSTIILTAEDRLTLRDAVLRSGGVPDSTTPVVTLVTGPAVYPSKSADQFRSSSEAEGMLPKDAQVLERLRDWLGNTEAVRRLVPSSGFADPYLAPTTTDAEEFLQDALSQLLRIMTQNVQDGIPAKIDTQAVTLSSPTVLESLNSMVFVLEAYQSNHPEFASEAILDLHALSESLSANERPPALPENLYPGPPAVLQPPTPARHLSQWTAASPAESFLIGLENKSEAEGTIYVHPRLVNETAIGNAELREGDFVFAIAVSQTTLASNAELQFDIPRLATLGLSEPVIDPTTFRTTLSVLQRAESDAKANPGKTFSLDSIAVLRRDAAASGRSETYYLPLPVQGLVTDPIFEQLGRVRPRDVFLFTDASRCPLVLARILGPAQRRLESQAKACAERIQTENRLRPAGRFSAKAVANLRHYARPVVQSARNLFE